MIDNNYTALKEQNARLIKALRDIKFQYIKRGIIPAEQIVDNIMSLAQQALTQEEEK